MKKFVWLVIFITISSFIWADVLPDNWTGDTDIETYKEETTVHGGTYSCKVVVNSGTQANCDFSSNVAISVNGDDTYTYSFWVYMSDHVRVTGVLDWDGSSTYSNIYVGPATGGWSQFTYSATVPTGATAVNLRMRFYDTTGFSAPETCYVDDVTFESPTGTSLTVTNGDFESWPTIKITIYHFPALPANTPFLLRLKLVMCSAM